MDLSDIEEWRQRWDDFRGRAANVSRDEIARFAECLGRKRRKSSTKHPMYESPLPDRRALSIPGHSKLKKGTVLSILKDLAKDIDSWEGELKRRAGGNGHA